MVDSRIMIKTRKDLRFYLKEDAKRNGITSWWKYHLQLLVAVENARVYHFLVCLRKCEYHYNNKDSKYHYILYLYYQLKKSILGTKYHIKIPLNKVGYGVRIMHLSGGGGILLNIEAAGNYCGFNAGVLLGSTDDGGKPKLGNYVAFGPGSKAFGDITIGDNVFVAPNSCVVKDVPSNVIVGGVPAKIIKEREIK